MRILIVNRALGTLFGGGESFDLNAAKYLQQRGHEVIVVTGQPIFAPPTNRFSEVEVKYVRTPGLRRYAYATQHWNSKLSAAFYHLDNFLFEVAVHRWLRRFPAGHFDIVQCCSLFNLPSWLLRDEKQPVVSWLPGPPSRRIKPKILKLFKQAGFGLYTHGSPEWTLLEMGLKPGEDFHTIGPGVELRRIEQAPSSRDEKRQQLGLTDQDLLGITTARLIPIKNHNLLFTALAQAKQRGVIWHWLIVGSGPLEPTLKAQAEALGIKDQVHFQGYQTQEKVHQWLSASDLFGLSSLYENFSIATLEAMGHGLPCFGTDVGYLRYLIQETGAGLVSPSNDSCALAEVLIKMSDRAHRLNFGAHGKAFVKALDWPQVAQSLEELFAKTMSRRSV